MECYKSKRKVRYHDDPLTENVRRTIYSEKQKLGLVKEKAQKDANLPEMF